MAEPARKRATRADLEVGVFADDEPTAAPPFEADTLALADLWR